MKGGAGRKAGRGGGGGLFGDGGEFGTEDDFDGTFTGLPSSTAELEQENQRLRARVAQLQRDLTNR